MKRALNPNAVLPQTGAEGHDPEVVVPLGADPDSMVRVLMATGLSEQDAHVQLWMSGDPACRERAAGWGRKLLEDAGRVDWIAPGTQATKAVQLALQKACPLLALGAAWDRPWHGTLDLTCCTTLESLPNWLQVGENLVLKGCTALRQLSDDLRVYGSLDLEGCTALERLPVGLEVGKTINMKGCTALKELPDGLRIGMNLNLGGCTALEKLPKGLKVHGLLDLEGCMVLKRLQAGLQVGGTLSMWGCTSLRSLPVDLQVGGLMLQGCAALRELPAGLKTEGDLYLRNCTALECLPRWLKVGGHLNLGGCAAWNGVIHEDTKIGGKIYADVLEKGITLAEWRKRYGNGSCFGKAGR